MNEDTKDDKQELEILNYLLHIMVGSYVIGWGILAWNSRNVPLLNDTVWRVSAAVVLGLTIWLATTLSLRALVWWSSSAVIFVSLRSIAYANEGLASSFGVWMLVLSGVSVTTLAIISVQALTGRLPKELR